MKHARMIFAAVATSLLAVPAFAGIFGNDHAPKPPSGAAPAKPTSVPEPGDAVLVLMGAAGVIVGRKLHARARRDDGAPPPG